MPVLFFVGALGVCFLVLPRAWWVAEGRLPFRVTGRLLLLGETFVPVAGAAVLFGLIGCLRSSAFVFLVGVFTPMRRS